MTTSTYRVFSDPDLLAAPVKRAAYSDRMALLMAEMSKIAYLPFEDPGEIEEGHDDALGRVVQDIRSAVSTEQARELLQGFVADAQSSPPGHGRRELSTLLGEIGYSLVKTYDAAGTQAFLAVSGSGGAGTPKRERIAVLSFRGTEKDVKDIKTDLNAGKSMIDGIPVHTGWWEALKRVQTTIESDVAPLTADGYSLYLTGHSLGGALALIATREIGDDSTGACYTFGSPRVAGYGFAQSIKTPIYRVVNANDVVPRLPPAVLPHLLLFAVSVLPIPGQKWVARVVEKFVGYTHHGDMRYLTRSAAAPDYGDVRLFSNPNMLHRLTWYIKGLLRDFGSPTKDHGIDVYCRKLKAYARRRMRD